MKILFRQIAFILALTFSMSIPVFAATPLSFNMQPTVVTASEGDTLEVSVSMSNNPGLAGFILEFTFDSDVFYCSEDMVSTGTALQKTGNTLKIINPYIEDTLRIAVISTENILKNGELFKIKFDILSSGTHSISMKASDVVTASLENLPFEIENSTLSVDISGEDKDITPPQTPEITVPPSSTVHFTDVPETHWAYTYVQNAVKNGLFSGIGNGMFGPTMNVTRGMFVTTLYSSAGSPDVELSNFTDVPADAWYAKAVAWASQQGIVSGIGNNKFGPELPITREQIALILFNYADGVSPGTEMFVRLAYPDAKDIHDWAMTAFTWAMNKELISGKSGNILDPLATATRAEVAVIMQNFVNLSK